MFPKKISVMLTYNPSVFGKDYLKTNYDSHLVARCWSLEKARQGSSTKFNMTFLSCNFDLQDLFALTSDGLEPLHNRLLRKSCSKECSAPRHVLEPSPEPT